MLFLYFGTSFLNTSLFYNVSMMQMGKKYLLIVLGALMAILVLLMRTSVWSGYLQYELNKYINSSGWSIEVEHASGYLFTTTILSNINLSHTNGSSLTIKESSINIGLFSSLMGTPVFDLITLEGLYINYFGDIGTIETVKQSNSGLNIPFHVRSLFVEGKVRSDIKSNEYIFNIMIGGEIVGLEKPSLKCDLVKVSLEDNSDIVCKFDTMILGYDGNSYSLKDINGELFGLPISGNLSLDKTNTILKGAVKASQFSFPSELFSRLPLKTKFSTFTGNFNFESDLKSFKGKLLVENQLGLDMGGRFDISKKGETWIIKSLELEGENSKLTLNGLWNENERVSCYMNLENFDLGRWIKNQKPTQMSGLFIMDAGLTKNGALDQIDMTVEMIESKLFNQGEISIHGQLTYRDSLLSTIDPVMLLVGDSYLTIDGKADFSSKTIDLYTDMERADIELVNSFLPGDFVSGKATGNLKISGDIFSPSALAELTCENVKISNFTLESIELNSHITVNETIPSGFIDIKADKGQWKNRGFESGTVSAIIDDRSIIIENCHFKSGNDFLQASGHFDGIDKYKIDRIQFAYQDNYMVNAKPLSFVIEDSIFQVNPFELHINDGMMEGVVTGTGNLEGRFKMSNFDAKILTQFFDDERLKLSGLIFGEVWIRSNRGKIDLDADLSLKKGRYMDELFDEMTLSCLYKNGMLHLDDITMTRKGAMGIQASGIIPFEKNNTKKELISLNSNFSNISLEFIHRFIPRFYKIAGSGTGRLDLNGTSEKTEFSYDINIDNAFFDLVQLGKFKSKGSYDGRKLDVVSASSQSKEGTITAFGSIPFDLNLNSSSFGSFFNEDLINFEANAQLSSLPFLSPYLADLDSANGNIDIQLLLDGQGDAINRNGYININNGSLYTLLVSDPIISIEGNASMVNNTLAINRFDALLFNSNEKTSMTKSQNTHISGTMDFAKFFDPGYDLKVRATNASYKLLFLDIEGNSNLNLSIVGKDTVLIDGIIETQEANVFYEFSTEYVGTAMQDNQGSILAYNLNIPIIGSAFFKNSQVNAKVTGELNLAQIGNEEVDFGGQIIVEDGSVISFTDYFDELQGLVSFDNKGFNPYIDVNANTMVDDERIELRMRGGIEDLDIILESGSGFSESDILELLTWGKRIEDAEWTSTGFGNQTVSILGTLLENQLEKNLKESDLGMMNYVDDIDISGAAGLLQGSNEDYEVTVKTKLSDKAFLNLSYKRSFSLNNDQKQIGVEYKLNRHFSVVGAYDEEGNLNLKYRYRYAY